MPLDNLNHRKITEGQRESSRRALETHGAQPSSVITLAVATNQQVMTAIANDDINNPTIDLAKQGLYNGNDTFTIFHPSNRDQLRKIITDNGGEINSDSNVLSRKNYEMVIKLANDNPSILYVN